MNKSDILAEIVLCKEKEVALAKQQVPVSILEETIAHLPATRSFSDALQKQIASQKPAVIAEIKRASPSKGIIRESFEPITIAKNYEQYGATCLSILTDKQYFLGSNDYLTAVRREVNLPILRKDFIIDPYQIFEARSIGADCILLIAAILAEKQLKDFETLAFSLDLDVLVEVHNREELNKALTLQTPLIGINNRNLKDFRVSLDTSIDLSKDIPANRIIIAESGIETRADISLLRQHHIHTFLIGETFMRAENPGLKLAELFID